MIPSDGILGLIFSPPSRGHGQLAPVRSCFQLIYEGSREDGLDF